MMFSLKDKEKVNNLNSFISLIIFGFSVSLDSFSVGITLNTISSNYILAPIVFSIISSSFTFLGLSIGKIINKSFGKLSILLGSIILFVLAIYYLFI